MYVKIYQIMHFKYVQFPVCQLYLNKTVKKIIREKKKPALFPLNLEMWLSKPEATGSQLDMVRRKPAWEWSQPRRKLNCKKVRERSDSGDPLST